MHRRRFLATAGTAAAISLGGCVDQMGGEPNSDSSGDDDSMMDETTSGGTPIGEHAAAMDLDAQPVLGDLGGNVIIAFEDPSCPRCRAFESSTVPTIESELVDTGRAAFVSRNYPVVYPWGEPATQALEAAFDRSDAAFWALNRFYYDNQPDFDTDTVLDETAAFLNAETDIDGDAVAMDAAAKTFDSMVQADLAAGESAGVGRTTPTIFLFRDGQYVTKASGSISYEIIATALGV